VTTPAVVVDDVSKKFRMYHEQNNSLKSALMRGRKSIHDDFWALNDISFEVPQGSTFGLIGRNGSGKSTLLKCLAKILGRENVFLNGSILGMTRREVSRRFDEIVSFAGVEKFIDQPVKNYSSGMYVRLGFSVAVSVTPDILVVDEVLAVGDAAFQKKCRHKFADMKRDGQTVILVSHSMNTVREMCDQVAWLDSGTLVATGAADEVISAYSATV
jgi:ABC-type polysaccharide/polyol phosphate transport system ATPase subunit